LEGDLQGIDPDPARVWGTAIRYALWNHADPNRQSSPKVPHL